MGFVWLGVGGGGVYCGGWGGVVLALVCRGVVLCVGRELDGFSREGVQQGGEVEGGGQRWVCIRVQLEGLSPEDLPQVSVLECVGVCWSVLQCAGVCYCVL